MDTVNDKSIKSVTKDGLCTGCGTCAGICPKDAIEMQIETPKGIYVPRLNEERCIKCGLCFKVCPGHSVDFQQMNNEIFGNQNGDAVLGNYIGCYLGHATNKEIRYNASSGGMVTALLISALEEGLINGALVTRMRGDQPLEPEPFIARSSQEIISASKSKYCPVPANMALKSILQAKKGERFAVVGLPCHIQGIRKAELASPLVKDRVGLHLGIVCGHGDSFLGTEFILNKNKLNRNDISEISYRGQGWPGSMSISLKNGTERFIPYREYMKSMHNLYFFSSKRCMFCADMLAKLSDITFMDAWIPEIVAEDKIGTSIIVSRSKIGETICRGAKLRRSIELTEIESSKAVSSQGRYRITNRDLKVHFAISRFKGDKIPQYNLSIPEPGLVNLIRASVARFNIWVGSKPYFQRFINPLTSAESWIFDKVKT